MSLKAELEAWAAALKAYDEEKYDASLDMFSRIADSSKILTNMGLIYATLGEHEIAVGKFQEAIQLDQYLAVAYFQCGVSNFLLARYELAFKDFEEALLYLRGNQAINYEQLGLKFHLYSAEVLFNKGLAQIYMGRKQQGMIDLDEARRDKATNEHNVIDDAIQDQGEGYTVFSIPVGVLYRPSEKKLKNAAAKDYMGKAKLIAASDAGDAYTTFTGVTRKNQGITPSGVYIQQARPDSGLQRSATAPAASLPKAAPAPTPETERTGLSRSKTTLNVVSGPSSSSTGLGRSYTTRAPPANPPPLTTRGLDIRKPSRPSSPSGGLGGKVPDTANFYDSVLLAYEESDPVPPVPTKPRAPDTVAAWARSNANPGYATNSPPTRTASRAGGMNSTPSSFGGTSISRRGTRRRRGRSAGSSGRGRGSRYEEEEEGYASGDYDDSVYELVKIRVKLHYAGDIRGMTLDPETPYEEFMNTVTTKFSVPVGYLLLQFKDEDGGRVSLRDSSDYDMAIETARESAQGKPDGKLEIWCTDA